MPSTAARRRGRGSSVVVRPRILVLAAACFCATTLGCIQQPRLYRWGTYEDSLYQNLVRRTEDPATQAVRLAADIARTEAEGRQVPPGVHAHLGWLLYSTGDSEGARTQLEAEKSLFPESSRMVDVMLGRLGTTPSLTSSEALLPVPPVSSAPIAGGVAASSVEPVPNEEVETAPPSAATAVEPGESTP